MINNSKNIKLFFLSFIILVVFVCSVIFDKELFLFFRNYNIYLWSLFDIFFSTKFWIFYLIIFGIYYSIKHRYSIKRYLIGFKKIDNKKLFLLDLLNKSRKSKFFIIIYSLLISIVLTVLLKYCLGRQRPVFFEALNISGFYPFTSDWAFNSMPSGHTSSSFAVLGIIVFFHKKLNIIVYLIGFLIGISRVCFGAHFLSDVILGSFIGVLASWISYKYIYKNN